MKKIMLKTIRLSLFGAAFCLSGVAHADPTDGAGRTWPPKGAYLQKNGPFSAFFAPAGGLATLNAGNGCILEGRLRPIKNEPAFTFTVTGSDGAFCPRVQSVRVTVLHGPAVKLVGNAKLLRISHHAQNKRVNFTGIYAFRRLDM